MQQGDNISLGGTPTTVNTDDQALEGCRTSSEMWKCNVQLVEIQDFKLTFRADNKINWCSVLRFAHRHERES